MPVAPALKLVPALAACLALPALAAAPPFRTSTVATGIDNGWAIAFLPDGRALVSEKPGRLRILGKQGTLGAPLAGMPRVSYQGQCGLLDISVPGSFRTSRLFYFSYCEPAAGGSSQLALAQARLTNDQLSDIQVIWRAGPATTGGQPGGRIISPGDGSLYVTTGERQQFTPAQDPAQTWGKIIRLKLDGSPHPANPFIGEAGWKPEIFSLGHRNPYGLVWDATNKILWEHEMGPAGGDEVNVILPGRNYGWPLVSNGDNYDGTPIPRHATRPDLEAPKFSWNPSIAPSGMTLYSGAQFPAWNRNLLLGALAGQALIRLTTTGTSVTAAERYPMGYRIRDVAVGPGGAVYLLTDGAGGRILKLTK